MPPRSKSVDIPLLSIIISLLVVGLIVFVSASLGTLAKSESKFYNLLVSQIALGLIGGGAAMYLFSRIKYQTLRKHAFTIFVSGIVLSLFVFIPGVGMEHGGAKRWIDLRITTFQPAELLKLGVILYLSAWLTLFKRRIHSPLFGIVPLLATLSIAAIILLAQRDTGTFLVAGAAGAAMYVAAGARWRDLLLLFMIALLGLGVLAVWRPYVRDRIATLIHHDDFQGSGYQLRQSLIAIGSGGLTGKGLGQSVQKFNYLPEAEGDSIFAVAGEEFGFWGTSLIVILYLLFALRGLWVASHAPDVFSGLFAVGLVILITAQSFINIGSMLAIAPLTGVPLVFVSHGGTALFVAMAESGMLLNISRSKHA